MTLTIPFVGRDRRAAASDERYAPESLPPAAFDRADDIVTSLDNATRAVEYVFADAERLEVELEPLARNGAALLTDAQIGCFNAILSAARTLLPNSKALREDVGEIDKETRLSDAHHALHLTIVPTLHNALPDDLYRKHS